MAASYPMVRRSVALAAFTLLLLLAGLWLAVRREGGLVGVDAASSETLLAGLADASGLAPSATGPAVHLGADGTTADTTTREYRAAHIASARSGLVRACHGQGLSPPGAEDRQLMPDIVCQGRWHDRDATVHLSGHCAASCIVILETRVI